MCGCPMGVTESLLASVTCWEQVVESRDSRTGWALELLSQSILMVPDELGFLLNSLEYCLWCGPGAEGLNRQDSLEASVLKVDTGLSGWTWFLSKEWRESRTLVRPSNLLWKTTQHKTKEPSLVKRSVPCVCTWRSFLRDSVCSVWSVSDAVAGGLPLCRVLTAMLPWLVMIPPPPPRFPHEGTKPCWGLQFECFLLNVPQPVEILTRWLCVYGWERLRGNLPASEALLSHPECLAGVGLSGDTVFTWRLFVTIVK